MSDNALYCPQCDDRCGGILDAPPMGLDIMQYSENDTRVRAVKIRFCCATCGTVVDEARFERRTGGPVLSPS